MSGTLPSTCAIAFKEWASVCRALADGRQTIILRKGGIAEGREGFRVEHRHFWLFPTHFHQSPEELSADAAKYLASDSGATDDSKTAVLQWFVQVEQVEWIESEEKLARFADFHIWSAETVRQRFHYKRPGLFLLVVRAFHVSPTHVIVNRPEYAGCKSWVPLETELEIGNAMPALAEEDFSQRLTAIRWNLK